MPQIKENIRKLINSAGNEKTSFIEFFITILIILNMLAIILESFYELHRNFKDFFYYFEVFSVLVFSVEYLLRIWVADLIFEAKTKTKARIKYIFSFLGLADILAILPFYLPFIVAIDLRVMRILRLLRILRILKLERYTVSMRVLGSVLKNKKEELIITIVIAFILMLLTSTIMYNIESNIQPDGFGNILQALWWSMATLTTVGYGDVYPLTWLGQTFAALTALFGIGLVAIPTGIISSGFIEAIQQKGNEKEDGVKEFKYCPHCGEKL
ncbi:ion transporter [Bacteroidota bacterium]